MALTLDDINEVTKKYMVPAMADYFATQNPIFLKARQLGPSTISPLPFINASIAQKILERRGPQVALAPAPGKRAIEF